jgi:PucR C-terminal helix-turn-helix domain
MRQSSLRQARSALSERLRARRSELEQAILTRVRAMSDPLSAVDAEYAEGLRLAVSAALEYGLAAIEAGEEGAPNPPPVLLMQARMAARSEIGLDTVLRRYLAGHTLLSDCLIEEASGSGVQGAALQRLLRNQATLLDRLLAAVSEEYAREERMRSAPGDRHLSRRVERLLAGELVDVDRIPYDFDGFHLGLALSGEGADEAVRALAREIDCNVLSVPRGDGVVWAWLGSRRMVEGEELERAIAGVPPVLKISASAGVPAEGLSGWRFTHRQARASLAIALRGGKALVQYADVAVLTSICQDELAADSLRILYLEPLETARDGGAGLRATLRAYFASDHNVSSTAAALGVNRRTVASRLRAAEERLGKPVSACAMELDAALRLEALS